MRTPSPRPALGPRASFGPPLGGASATSPGRIVGDAGSVAHAAHVSLSAQHRGRIYEHIMSARIPLPPELIDVDKFWLPLEHPCGCKLDWGVDRRKASELPVFLHSAAPYPCPMHGSMTGIREPALEAEEIRFIVQNGVYYRLAAPDQWENAARNRAVAIGN